MDATINPWWESELAGCVFVDQRLGQRLHKLIERMAGAIGTSLPLACQDWANTKAAYRFFWECRKFRVRVGRLSCSGHGSCEALAEENGELSLGQAPLTHRHSPLFLRPVQDQEQKLQSRLVSREMAPGPDRASEF